MNGLNNNKNTIVSIMFALFPLSFIAGNLLINLNVIFLVLISSLFYFEEFQKFKLNLLDKIVIGFFIYSILVLLINFFEAKLNDEIFSFNIINKTFLFLRYLLLYILIRFLIGQKLIKLDLFFYLCALATIFVCFDIFFQFLYGKDIFGLTPVHLRKLTGPFGDELIAGGYIQRFSLFALFLPFVLKQKISKRIFFSILILIIFFSGIVLSGNRVPLIMFILSVCLVFFLQKDLRKYFILFLIIISLLTTYMVKNNKYIKDNWSNLIWNVKIAAEYYQGKKARDDAGVPHTGYAGIPYTHVFDSSYKTWKKNKYFGGGIRSYRINCPFCDSHPHNYYFEILDDLGLFGFFYFFFFLLLLVYKSYKNKSIFFINSNFNKMYLPLFCLLFVELFPFRSTGSFFSTNNATYIFIMLAMFISLVLQKSELKTELKLDK